MNRLTLPIKVQLRQIAEQLPDMPVEYIKYVEKRGKELLINGVTAIKLKSVIRDVKSSKIYNIPNVAIKNANHVQLLNDFYEKGGILGVHNYLNSIPEHLEKAAKTHPFLFDAYGKYLPVSEDGLIISKK